MKRLLTRISALATVVALGLIAINQAQRSVGSPAKEAAGAAPSSTPSAPQEQSPLRPTFVPGATGIAARQLVDNMRGNPLRGPEAADSLAQTSAASTSSGQPDMTLPSSELLSADRPGAARRVDALSLRAGPAGRAADRSSGQVDPLGPLSRRAGAEETLRAKSADRAIDKRRPSGPMPEQEAAGDELANRQGGGLAPPRATGALGSGLRSGPVGGPREPAKLNVDPLETDPLSTDPLSSDPGTSPRVAEAPGGVRDSTPVEPGAFPPAGTAESGRLTPLAIGGRARRGTLASGSLGAGTGVPGKRQLEGVQVPQLSIQKSAPKEIQVGRAAVFRVTVRNTGKVAAHGVEVHDQVPKGTRLKETTPPAGRGEAGGLVWVLGTMKPGDEVSVEAHLMPEQEGEIGSVATVQFCADASARTIATRPQLAIKASAPSRVLIGEKVKFSITVSNPGSGVATGVVLTERVPPGLKHAAGAELEYEVGQLKPNESRRIELALVAAEAGPVSNFLSARGEANLRAEARVELEVIAPELDIAIAGPKRRFLEREATYKLSVSNPGSAPARGVRLTACLPPGLKFLNANNAGHYEANTRTIRWELEELPANETGFVELTAMPVEAGEQVIRCQGIAQRIPKVEKEQRVRIEGIAAILFEVVDVDDPIETGGETTYEIRVVNQGSKASTNVRLAVLMSSGMRALGAEGPTRHTIDTNQVQFAGLSRLAPKADTTYRVRVQGFQPGDQRVRVMLLTDQIRTPVTKEESTRVYSDE